MEELVTRRYFDVGEYYRMAETGILNPDERVELIDGEIIVMSPTSSLHASMVDRLFRLLTKIVQDRALIRSQNPVHLDDKNEPQPDISVVCPRQDEYSASHPIASEIFLLVEVAHSSVAYDKQVKLPLYARFEIPEYWLVNLSESAVEIFRKPIGGKYTETPVAKKGVIIPILSIPNVEVNTDDIFR